MKKDLFRVNKMQIIWRIISLVFISTSGLTAVHDRRRDGKMLGQVHITNMSNIIN